MKEALPHTDPQNFDYQLVYTREDVPSKYRTFKTEGCVEQGIADILQTAHYFNQKSKIIEPIKVIEDEL